MKLIVWALGTAGILALPAHAEWRYLILNEPLDQRVQEKRAEPVQPPSSFGNRVDGVLDIVMNGSVRGQADVIVTADGKTLISGDGARLAGLGFGPGDGVPQSGYFYPVADLRPAVQAQVDGSQLRMQTGVDTALHRTPGISRSESRPAVAPIVDTAPRFETRPLPEPPALPANLPPAQTLPAAPYASAPAPQRTLPWPDALNTPMPAASAPAQSQQEEVMIAVDGQPRGVVIARVSGAGQPLLAIDDLRALRLPVPAASVDRGYATPDDLSQTYSAQYDPAAAELRLSTRQPDRWYLSGDSQSDASCASSGPRSRPGSRSRRGDC